MTSDPCNTDKWAMWSEGMEHLTSVFITGITIQCFILLLGYMWNAIWQRYIIKRSKTTGDKRDNAIEMDEYDSFYRNKNRRKRKNMERKQLLRR